MRGPRPLPTALRILQTDRSRGNPVAEPIFETDEPAAPEWLRGYALDEWKRLANMLYTAGVLKEPDQTMFAAYCMAYQHWRHAEEDLMSLQATAGALKHHVLTTTKGSAGRQHPLVSVANVARREMLRLAMEFGITPSSRAQIDTGREGDGDDAGARHFG